MVEPPYDVPHQIGPFPRQFHEIIFRCQLRRVLKITAAWCSMDG
jgi:hypothetical protein